MFRLDQAPAIVWITPAYSVVQKNSSIFRWHKSSNECHVKLRQMSYSCHGLRSWEEWEALENLVDAHHRDDERCYGDEGSAQQDGKDKNPNPNQDP